MQDTTDRRMRMLILIAKKRQTTLAELCSIFGISKSTARRDVTALSCSYPIIARPGQFGGIYISEDFRFGDFYLTDEQCSLLERLSVPLTGDDIIIMDSIFRKFKRPCIR